MTIYYDCGECTFGTTSPMNATIHETHNGHVVAEVDLDEV